jgi:predicted ATP-dependent endonuclease of OLD family
MAGSHGKFKNTIILLDDLGIYLHPSGQKDLLKTLERISRSNQIVYATNCPHMIDRDKLTRVRLVSKKKGKGTVIRSRVEKHQPVSSSVSEAVE